MSEGPYIDMSEDGFEYVDIEDMADKAWWEQDGLYEFDPSDLPAIDYEDANTDEFDSVYDIEYDDECEGGPGCCSPISKGHDDE